ncbi:MAG: alpha/beta hydrolase, partial [Candidimonas sp.]
NAPYVAHLGTMNVIEDLDALRRAVGDEKLAFAGYSYGTRIGSVYAQVYPAQMGPVLLDGAVDPTSGVMRFVAEGGRAMDEALGHYFQFEPEARGDIDAAWRLLSEKPLVLADGLRFTRWNFLDIALLKMTFQADMPKIGAMARRIVALEKATASERDITQGALRKALTELGPNTDTGGMFAVVNCLDYADRPGVAELAGIVDDNASRGGMFGGPLTSSYAAGCAGFDFKPDPIPLARPIASEYPVLIGGATRDSRTPYQWAVQMARAFPNSRMLTYSGGNHVNWFISSPCLKSIMDDYFVDGRLPPVDAVCDYAPTPGKK